MLDLSSEERHIIPNFSLNILSERTLERDSDEEFEGAPLPLPCISCTSLTICEQFRLRGLS